jgi:hypothetical protein
MGTDGASTITASHPEIGEWELHCPDADELLFTENETNTERLWGQPNATPYVKDAFHDYVVGGRTDASTRRAPGRRPPRCTG